MKAIKRSTVVLVGLALVLLLTSSVFAASYEVIYVYYEDENENIVKVDYAAAVDKAFGDWPRDRTLYDAAAAGVRDALGNFRDVWVVVLDGSGNEIIILYSAAVDDAKTLKEAVEDSQYHVAEAPEYTHELQLEAGKAEPKPAFEQDWLDEIRIAWSGLADRWVVDIILDANGLSELDESPADWKDIHQASIRGLFVPESGSSKAVKFDKSDAKIDEDNPLRLRLMVRPNYTWGVRDQLVITYKDIRIQPDEGGNIYYWDKIETP